MLLKIMMVMLFMMVDDVVYSYNGGDDGYIYIHISV